MQTKFWQRIEGAAIFIFFGFFTWRFNFAMSFEERPFWLLFILFWLPDLCLVAYAFGTRLGSLLYNLTYNMTIPFLLLANQITSFVILDEIWTIIAILWLAHIGFNRMNGRGLKA